MIAKTMAENRPGTIVWCMGVTQHHIGNQTRRGSSASCNWPWATSGSPAAAPTSSAAMTTCRAQPTWGPIATPCSCYYGLAEGAWKHWARVWGVDYEWIKSRFDMSQTYDAGGGKMDYTMNIPGIPVSRWIDGVLEDKKNLSQKDNLRAVFFQGHACNSQTRGAEMKKALEKLDMVVISDPYPTHMAVMSDRKNDTYLLPTCTQFETVGFRDGIQPLPAVARKGHRAALSNPCRTMSFCTSWPRNWGLPNEMFKNIKVEPTMNRSSKTSCGKSTAAPGRSATPARARSGSSCMPSIGSTFDTTTLKAEGGPCNGEYYGLPWPCWGNPEMKHPGTPILYDPSKPVAEGGLVFRASLGTEHNGQSLLADGVYSQRLGDQGRLSGIHRRYSQETRLVG